MGIEKTVEHESDGDTNCNWYTCYSHQRIGTRTGGLRNKRTSGDHPNISIMVIGQNTENSSGHLRNLAVTQTPVRNHRPTLVSKTRKGVNNCNNNNNNCCARYSHQRIDTGTGGLGNKRTSRDHPSYNIIEIIHNTEKDLGDLRRLDIIQTPVRNHHLMPVWKTPKRGI